MAARSTGLGSLLCLLWLTQDRSRFARLGGMASSPVLSRPPRSTRGFSQPFGLQPARSRAARGLRAGCRSASKSEPNTKEMAQEMGGPAWPVAGVSGSGRLEKTGTCQASVAVRSLALAGVADLAELLHVAEVALRACHPVAKAEKKRFTAKVRERLSSSSSSSAAASSGFDEEAATP